MKCLYLRYCGLVDPSEYCYGCRTYPGDIELHRDSRLDCRQLCRRNKKFDDYWTSVQFDERVLSAEEYDMLEDAGRETSDEDWEVFDAIVSDDKDGFLKVLKEEESRITLNTEEIWYACWRKKSVNCARALLKGEAEGFYVDASDGLYVRWLHFQAHFLCIDWINLLLELGAPADMVIYESIGAGEDPPLLPLHRAIDTFSSTVVWNPKQTAYWLIYVLCHEELNEQVKILRTLANHTPNSVICEAIRLSGEEGNIVKLATLLMVASKNEDVVKTLYGDKDHEFNYGEKMTVRQSVAQRMAYLTDAENKLVAAAANRSELHNCQKKKEWIANIMLLIEIFQRSYEELTCHFRTIGKVDTLGYANPSIYNSSGLAEIFSDAGFVLEGQKAQMLNYKGSAYDANSERARKVRGVLRKSRDEMAKEFFLFYSQLPDDFTCSIPEAQEQTQFDTAFPRSLTLQKALEKLSNKICWSPEQSIYKLIIMLCLPNLQNSLATLRLIAQSSEKINEITYYYAKTNKVVELAMLLLVAREKVLDHLMVQTGENISSRRSMTIQECLTNNLAALIILEYRYMGVRTDEESKIYRMIEEKKLETLSSFLLIEIFQKAGPAIETYLQSSQKNLPATWVAEDISRLLEAAGFKFKSEDVDIRNVINRYYVNNARMQTGAYDARTQMQRHRLDTTLSQNTMITRTAFLRTSLHAPLPSYGSNRSFSSRSLVVAKTLEETRKTARVQQQQMQNRYIFSWRRQLVSLGLLTIKRGIK